MEAPLSDADVLRRLEIDLRLRQLRPATQDKYRACVRAFLGGSPVPVHRRTRDDVRDWLLHLLDERQLAPSTYATHLAALRFLFAHTVPRPRLLAHVPRARRRPAALVRPLSRDELRRLFAAAPHPTARLLFQTAYGTGLRLGELCRLRGDDVDPAQRLVTVHEGKGGAPRVVACGRVLGRTLPSGSPRRIFDVAPRTASRWFRSAAQSARLPRDLRFHGLRHAFATHLVQGGADLLALRSALGHQRLETTVRYVRVDPRLARLRSPLDALLAR